MLRLAHRPKNPVSFLSLEMTSSTSCDLKPLRSRTPTFGYIFSTCRGEASLSLRGGSAGPLRCSSRFRGASLRANSDWLTHNVCMSERRTKADKAQRDADLLDKKSSHRPPQNQGRKTREDFNRAIVRIVEEAAEKQRLACAAHSGRATCYKDVRQRYQRQSQARSNFGRTVMGNPTDLVDRLQPR